MLNVATNAIDAVEESEDGRVLISTAYDEESELYSVIVKDNGPGIPDSERKHIFDLFESTKGARGTGLGLAVSQKIMNEHGGEITVECPEEGGCVFCLRWPRIIDEAGVIEHTGAPTRST